MADTSSSPPRVTVIIEHDDETTLVTFTGPHEFNSFHRDDEWRRLDIAGVPDSYTFRRHPSRQAWLADILPDIATDLIRDCVYEDEPDDDVYVGPPISTGPGVYERLMKHLGVEDVQKRTVHTTAPVDNDLLDRARAATARIIAEDT